MSYYRFSNDDPHPASPRSSSCRLMEKSSENIVEGEEVVDEKVIEDCAYLAFRSHLYKDTSYYGYDNHITEVLKVSKESVQGGDHYWITFVGCTKAKSVETFEVVVFQDLVLRKVIRTRTVEPSKREWYDGGFTAPLIRVQIPKPTPLDVPVPTDWFTGKHPFPGCGMPTPTSPAVPTPMDIGSPSDVIAKQKLNLERRRIAESCAVLAFQDYAIQVSTGGLRFIKLVKADAVPRTYGLVYTVFFKGSTAMNGVAIFIATVWETTSMRQVMHVRTIRPRLGEWYEGKLVVPL